MILITPSPANFAGSTAVVKKRPAEVEKRPAVARLAWESVPETGLTRRRAECLIPSSLDTCHTNSCVCGAATRVCGVAGGAAVGVAPVLKRRW